MVSICVAAKKKVKILLKPILASGLSLNCKITKIKNHITKKNTATAKLPTLKVAVRKVAPVDSDRINKNLAILFRGIF